MEITNIKDFANALAQELSNRIEDVSITVSNVKKNNELVLTGLVIRRADSPIAPSLYAEGFYEQYQQGKTFEDVVALAKETYFKSLPTDDYDLAFYMDYEKVKPLLFAKVVNLERNKAKLDETGVPYEVMCEDLAIVPIVRISNTPIGDGTITIRSSHMDTWGIDKAILFKDVSDALLREEANCFNMMDFMCKQAGMPIGIFGRTEDPTRVLTTKASVNGAIMMFHETTLKNLCDKLDCKKLAILPSSIHEVIILPDYMMNGNALVSMVKEVNATTVSPEEQLSDHVYIYDSEQSDWYRMSESEA